MLHTLPRKTKVSSYIRWRKTKNYDCVLLCLIEFKMSETQRKTPQ